MVNCDEKPSKPATLLPPLCRFAPDCNSPSSVPASSVMAGAALTSLASPPPGQGIPEGSPAILSCPYGIASEEWRCWGGDWEGADCSKDRAGFKNVTHLHLSVTTGKKAMAAMERDLGAVEHAEDCFSLCADTKDCWGANVASANVGGFTCHGLMDLPREPEPSANADDLLLTIAIP